MDHWDPDKKCAVLLGLLFQMYGLVQLGWDPYLKYAGPLGSLYRLRGTTEIPMETVRYHWHPSRKCAVPLGP